MSFDLEAHIYPPEYIDTLEKFQTYPRARRDSQGHPLLEYTSSIIGMPYSAIRRLVEPVSTRLKLMDSLDIEAQLLSTAIPGAYAGTAVESVKLARNCNNYIHSVLKEHTGRFFGLATLPILDLSESLNELERVMTDLEFSGVEFLPSCEAKFLDSPAYWKIYERMQDLGATMRVHSAPPYSLKDEFVKDYGLWGPSFGFTVEAALAILRLIFSGMLEQFPKLKILILHLGEALPYLFNRLDRGYKTNEGRSTFKNLHKLPHEYLRDLYVDTGGVQSPASLECAVSVLDPNKLVFGSDFPFEDLLTEVDFIRNSSLQPSLKKSIMIDNCRSYLGL